MSLLGDKSNISLKSQLSAFRCRRLRIFELRAIRPQRTEILAAQRPQTHSPKEC